MNPSAVCVGDNCIDYYLPPINQRFVGGNALNVAVHLQDCGIPTAYVGVVGDDAMGEIVLDRLSQKGIDFSQVRTLPGQSAHTHIRLSSLGDREFVFEHLGPQAILNLPSETIRFIQGHQLIHTTQLGGAGQYLPQLKTANANQISMDYGERSSQDFIDQTIGFVDLAFFSLPEILAHQSQEMAIQLLARGPRIVIITMGAKGSLVFNGEVFRQPAVTTEVVDTLGAGDRYIGTFLAKWLQQNSIPECMQEAAQAATETCTHYGAWPQSSFEAI